MSTIEKLSSDCPVRYKYQFLYMYNGDNFEKWS